MAKLKLNRIKRLICSTCKGNGYLKVGTEWGQTVHQCWDCDSDREFYETAESDTLIGDTDGDDNYSNKLH